MSHVATIEPAPAPAAAPTPASPPRRRRRWHRLVIPFGLVAVFWLVTLVAHSYQEPDFGDSGTLSPTGTGRHGSSELADRLRAEGIEIVRVTSSIEAVAAAREGDATILVPAPDLMDGRLMLEVELLSGQYRVVFVKPGRAGRLFSFVPAGLAHGRWAATTAEPECTADYAVLAGAATVHRDIYGTFEDARPQPSAQCYGNSLFEWRSGDGSLELIWVGATEPFRNDRIDEAGNAALATGLLSGHDRLIWLDLHASEIRIPLPDFELPDYDRGDQDRTNSGDSPYRAFPTWLWAAVVLLLATGLLLAIARARRLGPPVAEPLPVLVPAAEAVLGRGRLYRRIQARAASLATLRAAALPRLARVVDPLAVSPERALATPGPARDSFVRALATRAGVDEATVVAILFGPEPGDDAGLVAATASLDRLVAIVAGPLASPPGPAAAAAPTPSTETQQPGGQP